MWKLFHSTINAQKLLKFSLQATLKHCRYVRNNVKTHTTFSTKSSTIPLATLTKIGVTLGSCTLAKLCYNKYVYCDALKTRMAGFKEGIESDVKFDWILLWHYLRPHFIYLVAAIIGALIVALLNIQIPQLMGGAINVISKFTSMKEVDIFMQEIRKPAFKLISMYLAQSFFTFFYILMLSNIGEKVAYNMRKDLFTSIIRQEVEFFDNHRTGELINRLTSDIQDFKSSFKQTISGGLRAGTQIIGCSISLVLISPQMTLLTLLCIPTVIAVGTVFGSLLRQISRHAQAQAEKTTAVADEAIGNIRTVRAFAMERQEEDLFDLEAKTAMQLNQRLGVGIGLFQAGTNLFLNSMVLTTLYMGGYLLSTDQLSAGDLMAYLMATQTIQRSLAQMSLLFGAVMRGAAAGSRVFEFINLKPKVCLDGGNIIPDSAIQGNIEFRGVTFAYPTRLDQPVLDKFNLEVPAGKTVAIVGASGNGKSTVVALIERFYDIKEGVITLDGNDIRTLNPTWLRQNILGLISQEPILFGTTVMENIRYGKPSASDDEVIKAAKLANAHDFINGFPKGYNTMVGERGAALSGGQKQRIAIARALLKNPAVLILDEATSALDAESEKIVQAALDKARSGRTVIVIAHRLSTIQNADIIVVLNQGQIVEMGTHETLQKLKGYYYSLTYQQQRFSG